MRKVEYIGNRSLQVEDYVALNPLDNEVQIRVSFTGLCGTDLHIVHGSMDARVEMPLTFGHEMSGVVEKIGVDVQDIQVGDHVSVMPLVWDGECPACRAGNQHICHNLNFIGIDSPGSLQTLWNVPASTVIKLPMSLDLRDAALLEPVAVAVHDFRRSELKAGMKAVIVGGGPIGLLIASVARYSGVEVVVIELDPLRRSQITELGFAVIDPVNEDANTFVSNWTGGAGADVVFEVSGSAAALNLVTSLAKSRGTIVVVAIHPEPRLFDFQRVFWRELRILGARVYDRTDFELAISLIESGHIPCEYMISKVVKLDDVADAMDDLKNGRAMKILVEVGA